MKETTEFFNWAGDMAVQAITLEPNQSALESATQFFDELIQAPRAIQGLAENFKVEAQNASVDDVKGLFLPVYNKLVASGVDDKAAHLIATGLETAYTGYSLAAENQAGQEQKNPA